MAKLSVRVCVAPNVHTFLDGVMGVTMVLLMVSWTINKTTVTPITPSRNVCTFSKKKKTTRRSSLVE